MIEYVRVSHLKEGDVLGKTVYNDKLQVLLKAGNRLTKACIQNIREQGYKGVYIEVGDLKREAVPIPEPIVDEYEEIVLINLIMEMFRNKKLFEDIYNPAFKTHRTALEQVCRNIVKTVKERDAKGEFLYELEDGRTFKNWLAHHSLNTAIISAGIAYKIGLNDEEVWAISFAGMMHDLGKASMPEELVNKKDPTEEERKELRNHPEIMFRILQKLYGVNVSYSVWQHHEKIDGSGYPNKLKSDKIRLSAQIVALASAFDNLVNIQPYNDSPMSPSEALEYLQGCCFYNVDCIIALLKFVVPYPVGTRVLLSNGKTGIVIKNVSSLVQRPYVFVDGELYNLAYSNQLMNVTIVKSVDNFDA